MFGKKTINREDYELYNFPWNLSLIGKNRKFINSQLEKNHPCYTESCCYDYGFNLRKGKINLWVLVMDKLKLTQYQVKNGPLLHVKELKGKFVFADKSFKVLILILLTVIIISGVLLMINPFKTLEKEELYMPEKITEEKTLPDDSLLLSELFSALKESNSKLISMELNGNELFFNVENCNPEKLSASDACRENKLAFTEFIYSEGKKSGATVLEYHFNENIFPEKLSSTDFIQFNDGIRKLGGIILSEDFQNCSCEVSVNEGKIENLLEESWKYMNEKNLSLSSFSFEKRNRLYFLKVCPQYGSENAFVLRMLSENPELFLEKSKTEKVKVEKSVSITESSRIIGRITDKDGNTITYWKTADGKIREVK